MQEHEESPHLGLIIQSAENRLLKIETQISLGNDVEADALSKLYEEQLESIFSYKCQTVECLTLKLEYIRTKISVDYPVQALMQRAFESLSEDVQLLAKG